LDGGGRLAPSMAAGCLHPYSVLPCRNRLGHLGAKATGRRGHPHMSVSQPERPILRPRLGAQGARWIPPPRVLLRLGALGQAMLILPTVAGHAEPAMVLIASPGEVTAVTSVEGKLRQVRASISIHATPERIWSVLTNCGDAVKFVPGLVKCTVVQRAADDSWERVRHVLRYSWYVPRLSYEFRADLRRPSRVDFERTGGDLDTLKGSWDLRAHGGTTEVIYEARSQLGFWVPQWLVRLAVKRDLPKMMRKLRDLSEPG
jgi:ribosome-associated toxin RatA of RatAB toxin-antitoxin module